MNFSKANNQYYAAYIESRVVAYINKEEYKLPSFLEGFEFSDAELAEMDSDAKAIAESVGGIQAQWTGRECSTESCDLIVDGREIELKYVSCGTGTYLNSSLSYFSDKLGFVPFTDYTHKTICHFLEKYFGEKVYSNFSPVSQKESSDFQHYQPELYEQLKKIDKTMRKQYVSDLYNFLIKNPQKLNTFITDVITKSISGKEAPEELIIFNHETKAILKYSKLDIERKIKNKTIKNAGLSLVFDEFRVAIGWQNGTGLNNPTLRVFIK
jgi:hypothetical protein